MRALTAASAVLTALAACTSGQAGSGAGPGRAPTPPATSGPSATTPPALRTVEVRLRQVVQIEGPSGGPAAPSAQFQPELLTIGKDVSATTGRLQSAALAFDPVGFLAGQCLTRATVVLPAGRTDGTGEIRAYPSAARSLADGKLPPAPGRPTARLDDRPFGQETINPDGTRTYDVTELIALWAVGATLPAGRPIPAGSPVVLLLRAADLVEGRFAATFDVAERPPSLTVQTASACPSPISEAVG